MLDAYSNQELRNFPNLVARVLRILGYHVVTKRDSGVGNKEFVL